MENFTIIAHKYHKFWNPISEIKFEKIIQKLNLGIDMDVIDFGAGNCELLIKLLRKYNLISVTAIEKSPLVCKLARVHINQSGFESRVKLTQISAKDYIENINVNNFQFDLVICVGSSHAFGDTEAALIKLKECTKPGGKILFGELYWKNEPSQIFMDFLGVTKNAILSFKESILLATKNSLTPLWAYTATEDEWDDYEWQYSSSVEEYIKNNPYDENINDIKQRISVWRTNYINWGRETLGFGLYLFSN